MIYLELDNSDYEEIATIMEGNVRKRREKES